MLSCIEGNLLYEGIGIWLLVGSVVGFAAMGVDKQRAVEGRWRVSETTLFLVALAGGAFGTAVGSEVFHHKTSKLSFLLVMYSLVVAWLVLLYEVGFVGCLSTYLPH